MSRMRHEGLHLRGWCADLATAALPTGRFDVVLVTRYLQRDLFPSIRESVRPGGFVLYETFTVDQRRLGSGPTSAEHLLLAGELVEQFAGFDVWLDEEALLPEAVARAVVRKPA
jgi:hypothetical protein